MKNIPVYLVILLTALTLNSCVSNCDKTLYYFAKVPVYKSLESIRSSFKVVDPQPMDTIVNIVELNHAYFLEEKGKGVHVIDKSSSPIPKRISFIEIEGCMSTEGSGNTLYVGQATDLVVIDVTDVNDIKKVRTVNNVFNEEFVKQDSFIIDYKSEYVELRLEDQDCADSYIYPENTGEIMRFSMEPYIDLHITNGNLISADNGNVLSFFITSSQNPRVNASVSLGFSGNSAPNQIRSTNEFIVIGNPTSNMFLFQNDASLSRVFSTFVSSPFTCGSFNVFEDVVFYADHTDKSNPNCNSLNRLHIHPINGSARPFTPFTFSFTEPQSISFHDQTMLLCNGSGGFSLFDVFSPSSFSASNDLLDAITTVHSKLGELSEERALIWGDDGLYYVNVETPRNISVIGKID